MYLDPFSRLSTALADRVENLRSLDRLLAERVIVIQEEAARFAQRGMLPHLREQCRLCHRSHGPQPRDGSRSTGQQPRDGSRSTGQQPYYGPRQPWNDRGLWAAELARPPPRRFPPPTRNPQVPPPLRSTVHHQGQNVFRPMAGRSDSRPATATTAAVEEAPEELERVGALINAALTGLDEPPSC